jgi:hypothetical protein
VPALRLLLAELKRDEQASEEEATLALTLVPLPDASFIDDLAERAQEERQSNLVGDLDQELEPPTLAFLVELLDARLARVTQKSLALP